MNFKTQITLKNIPILKGCICSIVTLGKSYQKGKVEKNHKFIRYVLPKGTSFDNLTQEDINLIMSHINSYKRKKLNNVSPYKMFSTIYGKDTLDKLTQQDVNILMSNINSYPREELNKCCPFDLANMLIGKNIINKFGYHQIEKK